MSELQYARGYAYSLLELWRGFWWVRRILNEQAAGRRTVLLSHLTRSNIINIALGLFTRSHKAVCVSHNSVGFYSERGFVKRCFLRTQGILFPLAYRTVCVSNRMASDYRRLWLFRKESILTLYNPVALPMVPPRASGCAETSGPVHIAMVGRLHAIKRHDLAVQAMALLKAGGGGRYVLHIVGDGPEEERVRQMISRVAVGDCVVMHGWMEDTSEILKQCCVSLLCSDTEGFPNSIVESLAHGVPVVATDCVSGPRELIAPDHDADAAVAFNEGIFPAKHGVLVELDDSRALARGIEYQAARAGQVEQSERCIAFARQFDSARVCREYARLIESARSR